MSTTLDARLAALKDGDTVKFRDGRTPRVGTFRCAHDDVIAVVSGGDLELVHMSNILWPPAPKAEPGKVYRHTNASFDTSDRVGTTDGRLFEPYCPRYIDFDPALWIEVPDEQEGR